MWIIPQNAGWWGVLAVLILALREDVVGALDAYRDGVERRVDLAEVNGRVFVNTSGGGFIGEVSAAVTPQLKTITGGDQLEWFFAALGSFGVSK